MERPLVLEWIRHSGGIWTLPRTEMERLERDFPQVRFAAPPTREEAEALLPEADAVLGFLVRPENVANAKKLRWVHTTSAGVEGVLFPELAAHGVTLTNSRGLHATSMSEHALASMFAFARQLHVSRDMQHQKKWTQVEQLAATPGFEQLEGATLGIVGFGAIGSALGARARALGMRVLTVRRHPAADPAPAHEQWGPDRLDDLMAQSDWIVLVAPATPESRGMIGAAQIARMKKTARMVNIGRGALVDEPALIAALQEGRIAGAALDVMAEEPLPEASPLWTLPNVIVTPHTGGLGPAYWSRAIDMFSANLRRFLAGETLHWIVDPKAGY